MPSSGLKRFSDQIRNQIKIFESPNFVFEEESHTYTYSEEKYDSVTTFIKKFKEPFNSDYWSSVKAAERGVSKETILNEWKNKADHAGGLGTGVHEWIENFLLGNNPPYPEDEESLKRAKKFEKIHADKLHVFYPISSELKVFSKKWRLAGTIDQLFGFYDIKASKYKLVIGDWKTNKEFKTPDKKYGSFKKMLRPFNDLYENHLTEYSIQLSMYRLILEESGIQTDSAFLCHIGPEGPAKIYPAYDLRERLKVYLDSNRTKKDIFGL
jgi:hypothetical protein